MLKKSLVAGVCAVATVVGVSAPATAAPRDVLGDTVRSLVADGFPGAIGYARVGEERWRVAAGYADLARRERATPAHRFRIASNTKAFTAAVVLQLVGEGRLRLDDPVVRYLPGVVPDGITVRQLLNHTSGLYDPTDDKAFWVPYLSGNRGYIYRPRDIVATAVAHPPVVPPKYSNTNYLVAGLLIEAITGQSAVSQIYRRIIVPLHLTRTAFPTVDPHLHGRHLHGYDLARNDVTVWSPSYDWTAGAIVSTLDDLVKFHRALFNGTLLAPAQLASLKEGMLGIERLDLECPHGTVAVWGNVGGGPGFNSYSLISADANRQLVLAMNTYDIAAELDKHPPLPEADPRPAIKDIFC